MGSYIGYGKFLDWTAKGRERKWGLKAEARERGKATPRGKVGICCAANLGVGRQEEKAPDVIYSRRWQ